jgi:DNA-binding MarR family transcriptional regulator
MLTDKLGTASAPSSPCADVAVGAPEIFRAVTELARRLRQFESRTLRESGLTPPQYFVLSLLSTSDGRPIGELAGISSCTRATMTGIADTLERKVLVRRRPNPGDRRSTLVWLTEQGRARVGATADLGEMFGGGCCCELLSPEESRELSRLLGKLADALPF